MNRTPLLRPEHEHPLEWARRKQERKRRTRRWLNLGIFAAALFFVASCWGDWSMVIPCALIALIVITELP